MILDFKSKTWETMQWQSAVYFKLGFQIPCLRSSSILNPRPGKPQIGSLHCISSLDFMPQIILDFKSKTWQTTDWQSALYFKLGFQIPCLRSSRISNPRPGKPQIGSTLHDSPTNQLSNKPWIIKTGEVLSELWSKQWKSLVLLIVHWNPDLFGWSSAHFNK